MMPLAIRRAAHWTSPLTALLLTLSLCLALDRALAAAVGDRVELSATHPAGVPLHRAPGGSQRFERVPGGTVATVIGVDRGGSWLALRLPDARTGRPEALDRGGNEGPVRHLGPAGASVQKPTV